MVIADRNTVQRCAVQDPDFFNAAGCVLLGAEVHGLILVVVYVGAVADAVTCSW